MHLGGDQLTSARICGSLIVRSNAYEAQQRLEGLAAVTEDWHTKVILLEVRVIEAGYTACKCIVSIKVHAWPIFFRSFGTGTAHHQPWMEQHCTSLGM